MRRLLFLLLLPAFFACKEKDLTTENPATSKDNVNIQVSLIFDTLGVFLDTVYTNNIGQRFYFTDMSFAFSDYTFTEKQDTVLSQPEPFLITMDNKERLIDRFIPGGYSGKYSITIGMDSANGIGYVSSLANDDELKSSDIFRVDKNGVDHILFKGKLFDPTNPLDSVGSIPFEFRVGTCALSRVKYSDVQNFSVSGSALVPFIIQINLWPVFNDMDIYGRPKITTDPTNQFDMDAAIEIADSLRIDLF